MLRRRAAPRPEKMAGRAEGRGATQRNRLARQALDPPPAGLLGRGLLTTPRRPTEGLPSPDRETYGQAAWDGRETVPQHTEAGRHSAQPLGSAGAGPAARSRVDSAALPPSQSAPPSQATQWRAVCRTCRPTTATCRNGSPRPAAAPGPPSTGSSPASTT